MDINNSIQSQPLNQIPNLGVWNALQLQDKRIEPDKDKLRGTVNRNISMGNIRQRDFERMSVESWSARLFQSLPSSQGGWFLQHFGGLSFDNIEHVTTLSRSVDGFNQRMLVTSEGKQTLIDNTQHKSFVSRMFGQHKEQRY